MMFWVSVVKSDCCRFEINWEISVDDMFFAKVLIIQI